MTAPWTPQNGQPAAPPGQRQWQHLPVPDVNAQPQPLPPSPVPQPQHTAPAEQRQEWAQPYFPPQGAPPQQPQQNSGLPPVQQPQAQPQQQPPQQQPPQFQGTPLVWQDANGRLFGQGVPQHLQGMTMQQVQALQSQPRPQVQQQPHQQPGYQQAPAQQPQQQATPAQKSFWSDPEGAIERIVDRKMAPVTASTQNASITAARQSVAQRFPNFNEYAAEVEAQLANVDPEVLTNPAAWQYAFERAVGARALGGAQGGFQQAGVPAAQPVVPAGAFFTESPSAGYTPGSQNMTGDGNFGLSAPELDMARRMNLTPIEYARGKGLQV